VQTKISHLKTKMHYFGIINSSIEVFAETTTILIYILTSI